MVAADVDEHLFNARKFNCDEEQALNIKNTLTKGKGGKIHPRAIQQE